ncbi:g4122 [Coccomyxa viridis]|uniref:G4122 protein n=1 Tax=Coccomyxa viridis TaxID=1274662 RepID=A0ABP1FR24_9CHLO
MALPERRLGTEGFSGTAEGYGAMSLTEFAAPVIAPNAEATLRHVLESGVTVINTAAFYGQGKNEEVIGRVIKDFRRDKIKITSKWGAKFTPQGLSKDLRMEACREQCEGSLKRMGVDHLDMFIFRGPPKDEYGTTIEQCVENMKVLVKEGKVKHIGLSECSPADVRRANAVHPVAALEMEWSLFSRDAEAELVPTARELGIGFLAYSPLGRGFLTGAIKKFEDIPEMQKSHNPRMSEQNFHKNMALVKAVEDRAAQKGCTPGQLALAWVLARGDDVIPIPGTKRPNCFDENLAALKVKLTPEECTELENAVPHHEVAGGRYPGEASHLTFHYD